MANRLHLDFNLTYNNERQQFVEAYLKSPTFSSKPPTDEELETMANYVLWGKDPKTGLNAKQDGTIELETRYKTWDIEKPDSLEALFELPGFHESRIKAITSAPLKIKKETFSREEALKTAPQDVLEALKALWTQIDTLELTINFYDLKTGKRKEQPRAQLLAAFTEDEINSIRTKAQQLPQYKYLKMRHLLVELRREQYTLRDSYAPQLLSNPYDTQEQPPAHFEDNIPVLPQGLIGETSLSAKVFPTGRFPIPPDFNATDLKLVSSYLWSRPGANNISTSLYFDFRNLEHLYNTVLMFDELDDSSQKADIESTLRRFIDTFLYYASVANLTDTQREILELKMKHYRNQDIVDIINPKYGKTYNANYISTIFRQKILVAITEAASLHNEIMENIFFEENFKVCKDCGEVKLLSPANFMRKAKSKDGYSARCKKCDKAQRLRREQNK